MVGVGQESGKALFMEITGIPPEVIIAEVWEEEQIPGIMTGELEIIAGAVGPGDLVIINKKHEK